MIEDDKYCIDILTQISAVNSALQSVALGLLDEHLGHCVTAMRSPRVAKRRDEEARRGVGRHRPTGEVLTAASAEHSQAASSLWTVI